MHAQHRARGTVRHCHLRCWAGSHALRPVPAQLPGHTLFTSTCALGPVCRHTQLLPTLTSRHTEPHTGREPTYTSKSRPQAFQAHVVTHTQTHAHFQIHTQTSSTHTPPGIKRSGVGIHNQICPKCLLTSSRHTKSPQSLVSPCLARLFKLKKVAPLNQLCPSLDSKGRSVIKTR